MEEKNSIEGGMGERLKALRIKRNLDLTQLGELIHMNRVQISEYENYKRNMTVSTFIRFCEFYGVTPDYLLTGKVSGLPPNPDIDEITSQLRRLTPLRYAVMVKMIKCVLMVALEEQTDTDNKKKSGNSNIQSA